MPEDDLIDQPFAPEPPPAANSVHEVPEPAAPAVDAPVADPLDFSRMPVGGGPGPNVGGGFRYDPETDTRVLIDYTKTSG